MKQKKLLKAIVPLVMVLVIGGIWFAQNQVAKQQEQEQLVATAESEFPLYITSVDFESLSESNLPVIIDFGADSCIPCKEMAPVLETLNEEMQGKAIVQFVDVWKAPEAANGLPIQVIPTQILVNADGSPYVPSDELASSIEFMMYADRETEEHIFTVHQGGLTEEQMRLILADMGVES